jgi:hypothetical protein
MIEMFWPTPVLRDESPWTAAELAALRDFAAERFAYNKAHPQEHGLPEVDTRLRFQHNLFHPRHEERAPEVWGQFKFWVDDLYRSYLREAYGVRNAKDLHIQARCTPAFNEPGMRAQPHYHHTCDHVLCLYLDCGYGRSPPSQRDWAVGDGELILQDPRPMAGFPFWEKVRYIETRPGLVVLHPSRVWHETNPFNAQGNRVLLVVTLRVASHNYCELYTDLGSPGHLNRQLDSQPDSRFHPRPTLNSTERP